MDWSSKWFSLSAVLALPLNSPIVRLDLPEFILEIYPLKGGQCEGSVSTGLSLLLKAAAFLATVLFVNGVFV